MREFVESSTNLSAIIPCSFSSPQRNHSRLAQIESMFYSLGMVLASPVPLEELGQEGRHLDLNTILVRKIPALALLCVQPSSMFPSLFAPPSSAACPSLPVCPSPPWGASELPGRRVRKKGQNQNCHTAKTIIAS